MNYYLGIDNGLTSVKAVLFDEFGNRAGFAENKTPVRGDVIDAKALWELTAECIKKAIASVESSDIKCIANSGHGNGLYAVRGDECIYAASSMSLKAEKYLSEIDTKKISEETLQSVWAGQPAAIIRYLKEEKPEIYDSAEHFMFCKDYVKYMLSQNANTDLSDASAGGLLNPNTNSYSERVFEEFGILEALGKMPAILESVKCAGYVSEKAAKLTGLAEGTMIASGAFDVNCCLIGSGAFEDYCIISGTWGINAGICENPVKSERIRQCCNFADKGKYICIDSAPTSANNLEWFKGNVLRENDYKRIDMLIESAKENDVLYLPFLYDPTIKANFLGLSHNTTDGEMLKAILEGVCFEHCRQLENLKLSGIEHKSAVISGGAANNDFWVQLFSDVLELPVTTVKEKQAGALGAAICAAVCSGQYKDIYSAVEVMVKPHKTFIPKKDYRSKYNRYVKAINLLEAM